MAMAAAATASAASRIWSERKQLLNRVEPLLHGIGFLRFGLRGLRRLGCRSSRSLRRSSSAREHRVTVAQWHERFVDRVIVAADAFRRRLLHDFRIAGADAEEAPIARADR